MGTKTLQGMLVSVQSVNAAAGDQQPQQSVRVDFDGFAGDKHRGAQRVAFGGERVAAGTVLRNDRQWSGVSVEELAEISKNMDLSAVLSAEMLRANICVQGIPDFSRLPRGSRLVFPSGAALVVEDYNAPCTHMGARIAAKYRTDSGTALEKQQFLRAAAGRRGVVGMVDVAGEICAGDEVTVDVFEPRLIGIL